MRRHRYEASRKSIFILLVRWMGKGTFQQSCEGNVRDLYEYPVKKNPSQRNYNYKTLVSIPGTFRELEL